VVVLHVPAHAQLPVEGDLRTLHAVHVVELLELEVLVVEAGTVLAYLADHVVAVVGVVVGQVVVGAAEYYSLGLEVKLLGQILGFAHAHLQHIQAGFLQDGLLFEVVSVEW